MQGECAKLNSVLINDKLSVSNYLKHHDIIFFYVQQLNNHQLFPLHQTVLNEPWSFLKKSGTPSTYM